MDPQNEAGRDVAVRDIFVGIFMLLLSVLYWFEANKIRISPLDGPVGASGLPKSLAYALGALSIIMIARSVVKIVLKRRRSSTQPTAATAEGMPLGARMLPHLRAIGMLLIGVGYLLTVSRLGYMPAIAGLLLIVALFSGAPFSLKTALFAIIGSLICYLLFVRFLGIPLPDGIYLEPFLQRIG